MTKAWHWLVVGAIAVAVFPLGYWVGVATAIAVNKAEFERRPEIENWADPTRGVEVVGLMWGLAFTALVALGALLVWALSRKWNRREDGPSMDKTNSGSLGPVAQESRSGQRR